MVFGVLNRHKSKETGVTSEEEREEEANRKVGASSIGKTKKVDQQEQVGESEDSKTQRSRNSIGRKSSSNQKSSGATTSSASASASGSSGVGIGESGSAKKKTATSAEQPAQEEEGDRGKTMMMSAAIGGGEASAPSVSTKEGKSLKSGGDKEGNKTNAEVVFESFNDDPIKVLKVRTYDAPPIPKNDTDIVVKVKASTISIKDCFIRRGIWHETISLPTTPGYDCVGVIVKVGDKVRDDGILKVGDAVAALVQTGGNARYMVIPSEDVVRVSGSIDSSQAASVVSYYTTAYQALHRVRPRQKKDTLEGSKILITGGNGPVGQAAIELALRAGAQIVYATALERFHPLLRDIGAMPLPLEEDQWLPEVKGQMDLVIDGICQDGFESPRAALNSTGYLVCVGMNLLNNTEGRGWFGAPISSILTGFKADYLMSRTSTYEAWASLRTKPDQFKHDMDYLFGLLKRGKINPKVAHRVKLEEVAETQNKLQRGELHGVAVVKPWK